MVDVFRPKRVANLLQGSILHVSTSLFFFLNLHLSRLRSLGQSLAIKDTYGYADVHCVLLVAATRSHFMNIRKIHDPLRGGMSD